MSFPHARHVRAIFRVNSAPGPRLPIAAKAGAAIAVPLLVGALLGDIEAFFLCSLGAWTVLYAPDSARAYRMRLSPVVAAGLVASTALGTLTAHRPFWALLATAVVAAAATALCHALKIGPPGAYMLALPCGIAGLTVTHGISPGTVVGMAALGAVSGLVIGMADLVVSPHGPERRALAAAGRAVDGYEREGGAQASGAHARAAAAMHRAWTSVRDGGSRPDLVEEVQDLQRRYERVLTHEVGHAVGIVPAPWGDAESEPDLADTVRGPLDLADTVRGPLDLADPAEGVGPGGSGQTEPDDDAQLGADGLLRDTSLGRPGPGRLLARALGRPTETWLLVARTLVATSVAGAIGLALHTGHPYWAALTATLVLHQGGTRNAQSLRGLQRALGTAAGLLVFAGLHAVLGAPWQDALVIVLLTFAIELVVVRNYALAASLITPLALTVASAGGHSSAPGLVLDRGLDTLVGVGVAFAVLWTTGHRSAAYLVHSGAVQVLELVDEALADLEAAAVTQEAAVERHRVLYYELLEFDATARRAFVDQPQAVRPLRDVERAVGALGFLVLGLAWHPERVHGAQVYAAARERLRPLLSPGRHADRPDELVTGIDEVSAVLRAGAAAR